jgi:glycosyltransferase involved in cell wall biosynthesis
MISIFTIAYNEEIMLPKFIEWYRERFHNCKIVVYDNYSTDNTEQIALQNNCEVIKYDSNGEIRDDLYLEIKNNCWKEATTDWVLICDVDELVNISKNDLENESINGTTIVKSEAWNMINTEDNPDLKLTNIKWGSRVRQYDKFFIFNKVFVTEINYDPGCHTANPKGFIKFSQNKYKMYHFRALSEDYLVKRNKSFAERLSEKNLKNKWGYQYLEPEESMRKGYKIWQDKSNLNQVIGDSEFLFYD